MIAQRVQAEEDTVRDVVHWFNEIVFGLFGPSAGGRCSELTTRSSSDIMVFLALQRATGSSRELRKPVGVFSKRGIS